MKAEAIVKQLATLLPGVSTRFTSNTNVTSLTQVVGTVTAVTDAPHNLGIGSQANITGAQTPINISSLTRSTTQGTLITDTAHDITENYIDFVELVGSVEAEFNGSFTIESVPDRNTIIFTMADSGATVATGSPLLLNGSSALQQYNGLQEVLTVPDPSSFTYSISDTTLFTPAAGTIVAKSLPRISGGISPERLLESYTEQPQPDLWAFVVLGDVFASKSRAIESDAVDLLQHGSAYRQQIVQPFSILVFFPTSDSIAALSARDDAEDVFVELCKSVLTSKFDSGLSVGAQNPVQFLDHGTLAYNTAFYTHVYNFQTVADITYDDTVGASEDVAFRDISLTTALDVGTGILTAELNLDGSDIGTIPSPVGPIDAVWENLINATATGNELEKTSGTDSQWNSWGTTQQQLASDGSVIFTATQLSKSKAYGLGALTSPIIGSNTVASINHAIYAHSSGTLYKAELGVVTVIGSWISGDILEVKRVGTTVTYLKNSVLVDTSSVSLSGTVHGIGVHFELNGKIENALIG